MKVLNTYWKTFIGDALTDDPALFDNLSLECQLALLAWIGYAIVPAKKKHERSSDDIRHDFEHVGFPISNGVFKGAMLISAYKPKERQGNLWYFAIEPLSRHTSMLPGEWWYRNTQITRDNAFLLSHLTQQQRKTFDSLAELARQTL
jgi:hypothetical protein